MKKYLSKAVAVILLGASVSLTAADAPSLPESVSGLITSIQQTVDPQTRRELMNDLKTRLVTLDAAQRQTAVERLQTALAQSGVAAGMAAATGGARVPHMAPAGGSR